MSEMLLISCISEASKIPKTGRGFLMSTGRARVLEHLENLLIFDVLIPFFVQNTCQVTYRPFKIDISFVAPVF